MSAHSAKSTTLAAQSLDHAESVAVEIGQVLTRDFSHLSSRRDGLAIQRGVKEAKRKKAVDFLNRIGEPEKADEFAAISTQECIDHKAFRSTTDQGEIVLCCNLKPIYRTFSTAFNTSWKMFIRRKAAEKSYLRSSAIRSTSWPDLRTKMRMLIL